MLSLQCATAQIGGFFMIIYKTQTKPNGKKILMIKSTNHNNKTTKQVVLICATPNLNNQGKQILNKLLLLQKIATANECNKLLRKVNARIYRINEFYRKQLFKINKIDFNNERKFNAIQLATADVLLND
jgi:hypothetical protein